MKLAAFDQILISKSRSCDFRRALDQSSHCMLLIKGRFIHHAVSD